MDELIPLLKSIDEQLRTIRAALEPGQKVKVLKRVPPDSKVLEVASVYGTDDTHLPAFLDATITYDRGYRTATAAVHARYEEWCRGNAVTPVHPRRVLRAIPAGRLKSNGLVWLLGVRLLPGTPQPPLQGVQAA